ncbi:DUF4105 domain-containing protein [Flavobacterium chuncheonense]|uniref:DUF4105 domain-containing protein n=1 Tax=Flavobacterium chuncheonense TaxID=2026653 RepID=A0ABW5YIX4_9FLAO
MSKKLLFLFTFLLMNWGFAQNITLSDNATISILNCGTGNESYSLYGHTGIRIKDSKNGLDVVFNYGAFDFDTPNFMLKFVKGDLQYFVTTSSYADFEYSYRYDKRSIYEQVLNLTTAQKQQLFQELYHSLKSDERYYTYKFIDRNCTTMVIDKVNAVLGAEYISTLKPVSITYRDILFPYVDQHFFEKLGINMMFGTKVDQPAERLFLPLEFIKSLEQTKVKGELLAQPVKTLYQAPENNFQPNVLNSIYTIILVLALIVLARKKAITLTYFTVQGILGVFFCCVGLYSFHQEVLWNYNALLFNPLFVLVTYFTLKKQTPSLRLFARIVLFCQLAYLAYMLDKVHLGIMSPFLVANVLLLGDLILKLKPKALQNY